MTDEPTDTCPLCDGVGVIVNCDDPVCQANEYCVHGFDAVNCPCCNGEDD